MDKSEQYLIENEISTKYTDGIDLNKVVKYHFIHENFNNNTIKKILKKEYKKEVDINRINKIIDEVEESISKSVRTKIDESKLLKTFIYNEKITIYLVVVNKKINSSYEFEIGFEPGVEDNLKVIISKGTYEKANTTRLVDILTDAICYNYNLGGNISRFLEAKSITREEVKRQFMQE